MIKLVSTFLNSEGKRHNFTFKDPDTTKSPEEIKESLELLSSLALFEKDGVGLFQQVVKAKYVETIERPIFEGDELFGDPQTEEKPEVIEENGNAEQLMALRCTWQEKPQVPAVTLESPIRSEVHDTLRSVANTSTDSEGIPSNSPSNEINTGLNTKEAPPSAGSPYDVVKELVSRRRRRKAKEKERRKRQLPPESPS
ncbi:MULTISPECIES: DUF2922 family protein [Enterococcus]|uniref:DUF2922 family protein n=1 Tax=Candidatus Enterococcus ferrettii TaxID=2815324 RepID=A0ABV0ETK4_9ENTE|nr:DUF2922 family protein [Enterococcus sp. 665A]MBO1339863.1 DUF2922 family protein [Enterococcus sp. 665A]